MSHPTYVEIEISGPGDQAIGFVEGFRLASANPGQVWFAGRENVDLESFFETLRSKLRRDTFVICSKALAAAMAEALNASELLELEVPSIREIEYAELPFRYEVYSREEASAVRKVIEELLPEGVRLEGYEPEERVLDDARGVELYGPVHDYTLTASGRYVGPVPGVLALAERLSDQTFIHPDKIHLQHAT